ncbi:GNAT family N-acetyltransferase [Methylocapsa aurea]|uniref:GNAT family N-acetyltransferase n=1 Tax=Methylocapsa aurea TaxID=663610 RepID=UPI000A047446|nr:GNAT family N-acetyltransferase [Methylocapsa aurea]
MNLQADPLMPDREIALREGAHIILRSVRRDDEARLRAMFAQASPEDIHYRCFGAMHDFAGHMAKRLAHLDPKTEVALVATTLPGQTPEEILGAVHIVQDPNALDTAEFDIMVRSDLKQHGLGYRLMTEILQCARQRGLEAVTGDILRDNFAMLQMAQELGFKTEIAEGADAVRVKVTLAELPAFAEAELRSS